MHRWMFLRLQSRSSK